MIAMIRACVEKLGHAPTTRELHSMTGLIRKMVVQQFGSHTPTLRASGLERQESNLCLPIVIEATLIFTNGDNFAVETRQCRVSDYLLVFPNGKVEIKDLSGELDRSVKLRCSRLELRLAKPADLKPASANR
jgi:hypothetical protein